MGLTRRMIQDGKGKIRGWIDVGDGDMKRVWTTNGVVGWYSESADMTHSMNGVVGRGDQRLILLSSQLHRP